jgi:hypothetical protein
MRLPAHPKGGVQVGVSDVLEWRDCAMRMQFGMRRHAQGDPPESWSPANAYGSAIHLCLRMLDDGHDEAQCAQAALAEFKQWLEPADLSHLYEDMGRYLEREMVGVRTLLNETEISIPLFDHPTAGPVWFRARIDRVYQSLDDPTVLFHKDFKSSKWPKSYEEVAKDVQLWAYNMAIAEWFVDLFPEFEPEQVQILQIYDQLNFGEIPTQKTPAQRAEIKRWLVQAITAIIDDEQARPTFNEWCPWCPLKLDCPVVQYELTEWARTRIAALMPREERHNKDGSVSKRPGPIMLDPDRIGEYVELMPDVHRAAQVLSGFEEELRSTLKEMPDSELRKLGKRKTDRSRRAFSTEAKRRIIEEVGLTRALMMFDLSLEAVKRFYGGDKEAAEEITALAESQRSYTVVVDA